MTGQAVYAGLQHGLQTKHFTGMHLSSESLPAHLSGHYCVKRLSCSSKLTSLSVQPPPAPSTVTRILQSSQQFKQSRLPATVQSIQLKVSDAFQIHWGRSRRKGSRLPAVTVQAQPHKSLFVPKWAREHQSRYCRFSTSSIALVVFRGCKVHMDKCRHL